MDFILKFLGIISMLLFIYYTINEERRKRAIFRHEVTQKIVLEEIKYAKTQLAGEDYGAIINYIVDNVTERLQTHYKIAPDNNLYSQVVAYYEWVTRNDPLEDVIISNFEDI